MHTLIVACNAKYVHAALAPWYLVAAVARQNAKVSTSTAGPVALPLPTVWETTINRPPEEMLTHILAKQPDVLAFCCYIWNIPVIEALLPAIACHLPACKILLGGPEVSYNAAERLQALPIVDYIICGEGEEPFPQLLAVLAGLTAQGVLADSGDPAPLTSYATPGPATLALIPGLAWRQGAEVVENPLAEADLEPPSPYLPDFFASLAGRIAYLETSRGCPFSCGFCLSGGPGGVRFFDLARVQEDLLRLAAAGSRTIKLVDRTFNCRPARTYALLSFILQAWQEGRLPREICFHLEVAADLFQPEAMALLQEAPAGLFQMEVGLQSFRAKTLAAVSRRTDLALVRENFAQLRGNNNIHLHLDLIAGLPEEGLTEFACSFDQAFALRPHMLQLGFLKLLHGSALRRQSQAYGIVFDPAPPYTVQATPWLSAEALTTLVQCEDALDRLYNSSRFPGTIQYLLKATGLGPFAFFAAFGAYAGSGSGRPLDDYIRRLYDFGAGLSGVCPITLRNHMVEDWLITNNTGRLPACLQVEDEIYGQVAAALDQGLRRRGAQRQAAGPDRRLYGFALLYAGDEKKAGATGIQVALADYRAPRPHLGYYPLHKMSVSQALAYSKFNLVFNNLPDSQK